MAGCTGAAGQPRRDAGRSSAIAVSTAPVQHISIQRTVDLAGTLISPDQAKVSAEAPGVVQSVAVRLGDDVVRGQELARLAPRELELALERAQSALRQTEAQLGMSDEESQPLPDDRIAAIRTAAANLEDARTQNVRAEQLSARGLLAGAEVEATRTKLKVAEAGYESAIETVRSLKASLQDRRASYQLAQKKLNDAVIRAPIAGAVSERLVQPGEFIKEDTPVITLVEMDPLKVSTAAQEKYAGVIKAGMAIQFSVESYPNDTFRGRIVSVSPAVDQSTRTFAVEADLPNPNHRLKPGFFAKGVILTHLDASVIAAPEDAISTLAGVSTVFVVENGKVRPQTVTIGVHQGDLIEIVEGLHGGETLATSNLSQLSAGVAVAARRSTP
ncbi:MAG TPA: efflux RND transporter periplasmic adaptor subunit [Vicinamibacterales bacterium]|nr:efflux RND transporter periplasmic adaptor subunit [Vicinamibacterales bacterium]